MNKETTTIEVTISQILKDLENGMTWLKKEDQGYGSIQEKYKIKGVDVLTIKKHPKLIGAEPVFNTIVLIDDTETVNSKMKSKKDEEMKKVEAVSQQIETTEPSTETLNIFDSI